MPNLKPFRDYSEHDVLNLFAYSGSDNVNKGTFVRIVSGWTNDDFNANPSNAGNWAQYANTVSLRYGVRARVTATATGEKAIGMTLFDVREVDENGEKLIYNPRKAKEMQAILSGQACPLATRGVFEYSGIFGTVAAGATLYPTTNGELTVQVTGAQVGGASAFQTNAAGITLGPKDSQGWCLIRINCI
jgi:hypothetical protein